MRGVGDEIRAGDLKEVGNAVVVGNVPADSANVSARDVASHSDHVDVV